MMNRRTALKLMALGLGMSMTKRASAQPTIRNAGADELDVSKGNTEFADQRVKVPMMHQSADFGYFDGGAFEALDLPYAGKELSMVVFLPKKADRLPEFEKTITAAKLAQWLRQLKHGKVDVVLPKFRMTAEFNLTRTLSDMGMPTAFTGLADFSGMSASRDLFISDVVHKAYVDVHEEGTEAAAATGVVMAKDAFPSRVFRADHPFILVIRDARLNSILFMGRVTDPRS